VGAAFQPRLALPALKRFAAGKPLPQGDYSFLAFIPPSSLNIYCGGKAGKPGKNILTILPAAAKL
jgi:hypothetical protein